MKGDRQEGQNVRQAYMPNSYCFKNKVNLFVRSFLYLSVLCCIVSSLTYADTLAVNAEPLSVFIVLSLMALINEHVPWLVFQGTFIIMAGIALNGTVVAMLYRPLSMHYRFTQKTRYCPPFIVSVVTFLG